MALGAYPTKLERLDALCTPHASLWIKRDDQTHPVYGGNKVRKLEKLLVDAQRRGATRILTVGAVGSHHVLTTSVFARRAGLAVQAVVLPQPRTEGVLDNLRADLAQGVELIPAGSVAHAALRLAARLRRGTYYVPPGGSNRVGVAGYVDAARELAAQVRAGEMPAPDLIVVALGSGGTAAGLAAGLAVEGLPTRVLGVTVAQPPWIVERLARSLARRAAPGDVASDAAARLTCDRRYLGAGYGHPTARTAAARAAAARVGLALDHTYTAKAFAAALDRVRERRDETILYWHTLSSASLEPLLRGAPDEADVDPRLRRLVREAR